LICPKLQGCFFYAVIIRFSAYRPEPRFRHLRIVPISNFKIGFLFSAFSIVYQISKFQGLLWKIIGMSLCAGISQLRKEAMPLICSIGFGFITF